MEAKSLPDRAGWLGTWRVDEVRLVERGEFSLLLANMAATLCARFPARDFGGVPVLAGLETNLLVNGRAEIDARWPLPEWWRNTPYGRSGASYGIIVRPLDGWWTNTCRRDEVKLFTEVVDGVLRWLVRFPQRLGMASTWELLAAETHRDAMAEVDRCWPPSCWVSDREADEQIQKALVDAGLAKLTIDERAAVLSQMTRR